MKSAVVIKIGKVIQINGRDHKRLTTKFWRPNKNGTFVVVSDGRGNFLDYNIKSINGGNNGNK